MLLKSGLNPIIDNRGERDWKWVHMMLYVTRCAALGFDVGALRRVRIMVEKCHLVYDIFL